MENDVLRREMRIWGWTESGTNVVASKVVENRCPKIIDANGEGVRNK